jgi:transcriptional antiterminator Rof (Rho-off)
MPKIIIDGVELPQPEGGFCLEKTYCAKISSAESEMRLNRRNALDKCLFRLMIQIANRDGNRIINKGKCDLSEAQDRTEEYIIWAVGNDIWIFDENTIQWAESIGIIRMDGNEMVLNDNV